MCLMKAFLFLLIGYFLLSSCSSDSGEIKEDLTPPVVSFSIDGMATVKGAIVNVDKEIVIDIDAEDAGGVSKIQAFVDDDMVAEDKVAPFRLVIDLSGYSSKSASKKVSEHTLRIDVSDIAGNINSQEVTINVDNSAPVITEVSLQENTVLNGLDYQVTFLVSDNEELAVVKLFLNDVLVNEISDGDYSVILNSENLNYGSNTLKIEAFDIVDNVSTYIVNFILDNIGPQITVNNLVDDQILDQALLFDLGVEDEFSEIVSLAYYLNEDLLYETSSASETTFEFIPDNYPTGNAQIVVVAEDVLANKSTTTIPVTIMRRLVQINIPQGFYQSDYDRFYVFASDMAGGLLAVERVLPETETFILRTVEEIDLTSGFMVTFGSYNTSQTHSSSLLSTVANVSGLTEINLRVPVRIYHQDLVTLPTSGFDTYDTYNSLGAGVMGGGQLQNQNTEIRFNRNFDASNGVSTDKIYVGLHNLTLDLYSYAIFDWDVESLTEVTADMFTDEGLINKSFGSDYFDGSGPHVSLSCLGFIDENQYQNWLWNIHGNSLSRYLDEYRLVYNTNFYKQRYSLSIGKYHVLGTGEVENYYPKLDWSLGYNYQNGVVDINTTGDHIVGKIMLSDDTNGGHDVNGKMVNYHWEIYFDSQNQNSISLPEIPEEMRSWDFYSFYEQYALDFLQVETRRYEGLSSYQEYLNQIIKDNTPEYLVSPKIESFADGPSDFIHYYLQKQTPIF